MYRNMDFFKFQKRFSSEQRCREYLFQRRWPHGFVCPKCQGQHYSYLTTRGLYQCSDCRYQCSVKVGTIFQKSKTPLQKWFWMIYLLSQSKNGFSALALQRLLAISYGTALRMSHKIRSAMAARDAHYQLAGLIELDDAYFGGKKVPGKRGRGSGKKTPVLVGVQLNENNRPQYAQMVAVGNLSEPSISQATQEHIKEGSAIKTDAYSSYKVLSKYGYHHEAIRMAFPEYARKFLPWVHILISNAKAIHIGTHHGVSNKHLQKYLSEFCYRFNRRFQLDNIFDRLTCACLQAQPITIAELSA
jgi:transposase-like protein